jgi:hypothetical protein
LYKLPTRQTTNPSVLHLQHNDNLRFGAFLYTKNAVLRERGQRNCRRCTGAYHYGNDAPAIVANHATGTCPTDTSLLVRPFGKWPARPKNQKYSRIELKNQANLVKTYEIYLNCKNKYVFM